MRSERMFKAPCISSSLVLHSQEPKPGDCGHRLPKASRWSWVASTSCPQQSAALLCRKGAVSLRPQHGSQVDRPLCTCLWSWQSFCGFVFSHVEVDAPALLSRQTMTLLDAFPDIAAGRMVSRALGTLSPLYLSSCGHLGVRLDEWPEQLPPWPCQLPFSQQRLPDAWVPTAVPVQAQALPSARRPADQCLRRQHLRNG